jgi:hypothetical protein
MNGVDWQAGPTMPSGWQEYREKDASSPSGFLLYDDDTISDYKIELVDSGTGRDGQTTGDDSGAMPDNVLSKAFAYSDGGAYHGFKFTGLNSGTYQIEMLGSYTGAWNWYTTYKIGGVEKTIKTDTNTSLTVIYTGISPASGEILIEMKGINGWPVVNGIILTEE